MRVLMLTSVWPTAEHPEYGPFIVRQVQFLRKQGVDVQVFPIDGKKDPRRYARSWREVRGLLSSGGYDLIHAQWAQSALAALPAPLPLVVTFRGSDVEGIVRANQRYSMQGWALWRVARLVARAADEAILVAERLARRLPRREYHVIPSGLDLDLFRPCDKYEARARLGLDLKKSYVLFGASPGNPVKRYSLAKAAAASVPVQYNAELITAGGIAPELMPAYMNACDCLLLTSAHEGSPNVVKEALACDLPVVSVDVGDVAERIAGVEGCTLCRTDEPQEIAAAIRNVLDRNRRVAGRAAVSGLDESILTAKVIGVYQRALDTARKRIHARVKTHEDLIDHSMPE